MRNINALFARDLPAGFALARLWDKELFLLSKGKPKGKVFSTSALDLFYARYKFTASTLLFSIYFIL